MATATFGRSGCGSRVVWISGRTNPDSSPFAQVTLMESQPQHPPSISPASAAKRTSAVPLNPSMTLSGTPNVDLRRCGHADVELPGPSAPNLSGRLDADQSANVLTPLFSVITQVCRSGAGVPSQPNFLPSKITLLSPMTSRKITEPEKWPMVKSSRDALLYK